MLLLFTVHTAYAYSPYLNSKTFPRSKVRYFRFSYSYIQYLSCSPPFRPCTLLITTGCAKSQPIFCSLFFLNFLQKFFHLLRSFERCSSDKNLEENMPLKICFKYSVKNMFF